MNNFVDRDGVPLVPGMRVEVRHCVGPYGQCQNVQGELVKVDQWGGLQLRSPQDASVWIQYHGRFGSTRVKPGDSFYLAMHWTPEKNFTCQRGYHKNDDYEHHHETWVKVLA